MRKARSMKGWIVQDKRGRWVDIHFSKSIASSVCNEFELDMLVPVIITETKSKKRKPITHKEEGR